MFGHGVIHTIFERGLGIHKVMGVTWWGGKGAFRKFPITQRKKCLVVTHVCWTIIVKGMHLTINEHN
jgi:hypothetical protein